MRFSFPLSPLACRDCAKDSRKTGNGHGNQTHIVLLRKTQNLKIWK
ncbi:hypothetical protein HMPREF9441_00739 [Paraprevotella clara YIT 11840]|uniref:Uncharacterized protein n=1 Tax=Paraprevotella clara YIT 11840 TaxID=762968 RepID=G5SN12_9BACT|nr:hypothetical protein HMPREF9441_00739 [Paraprevotella clara YIT 11840]